MILIICLHTVKWLQVLLFNTNYSIQDYSFICAELNCSKHCNVLLIIQLKRTKIQVLLFNANNSIQHYSFICTQFQTEVCITNNSIKHPPFVYTRLNGQTVLFLTIQFIKSTQFKYQTVLFNPLIGPDQGLPFCVRVNLGVMAMKTVHIPQSARTRNSPSDCLMSYPRHSLGKGSYSPAKMQSVYYTAPAD